jgi:nicotinate-nucleotide adenylyltransferase
MRRLVFGGSFNPIHHGHLLCAKGVAEKLGYDRVTLIPSALPPHKPASATLAASADRVAMTRLAVAGDPLFEVDSLEIERPGPSYTLDTARDLTARGQGPVNWLIGADMLLYLPKWHRPGQLLQEVNFIIVARQGWALDWEKLPPEYQHLRSNVVDVPLIAISATEIRNRVAAGLSIRYYTPDAVCNYIAEKGLYGALD